MGGGHRNNPFNISVTQDKEAADPKMSFTLQDGVFFKT